MNTPETLLNNKDFSLFARLAIAAVIAIVCAAANMPEGVKAGLCIAAVVIAAYELFITVFRSVVKLHFFSEHLLMLAALIVTLASGHYPEAVLSAMLFRISDFLCSKLRLHALDMAKSTGCQPDTTKKSRMETFAEKAMRFYVPAVIVIALLLALIPMIFVKDASPWLSRAAIILMVCCPCALTFSMPLCSLFAIYRMSQEGVALNAVSAMEQLAATNTIVLDKSDAISTIKYIISDVLPVPGLSSGNLLRLAAYAVSTSDHPAAPAVTAAYGGDIDPSFVTGSEQIPGLGVLAHVKGLVICAGSLAMMDKMDMNAAASALSTDTGAMHVAVNGTYAGCIVISKKASEGAKKAVEAIANIGTNRIVLFSSDSTNATARAARELGIGEYFAECSSDDKTRQLEKLLAETFPEETLTYIGNSSSLLKQADAGIAVGENVEGCDAVLTTEDMGAVADAILTAKRGRSIIMQSLIFALILKLILLVITLIGVAPFWLAVLADSGAAILTTANAIRAGQ
ncbi:MAG: HAD family hydrolase [Clostridiales bacterium]|nr:HAD family hydrolase [Clostridiales bacterium]